MRVLKKVTAGLVLSSSIVFGQNIASVNGETITDRDLLPIIGQITNGRYRTLDEATQKRVQEIALEQAVSRILLEAEAKKGGILKDKDFNEQLELAIKHLKRQLIADMWLKMELDKQSISIYEMKEFYKNNISEFKKPKQVHARHILLKTEAEAKYVIDLLSKYRGERLQSEFAESAKKLSTGPSGPRGGDLGYFAEGVMVPEFNDAVFSMKVGEISKAPVKTNFGYHIIYVEDKKESETASFEEAKEAIEQKLRVEKFQKFVESKINYLKSKAKIEIY
jgi:parvulin-like peptidyl-prolyl isomerase